MKISKLLLLGFAGAALVVIGKRLINLERDAAHEDELLFDTDFIPGSKKLNLDIPEHINPSWFRAPSRHSEDTEALFI